MSLYGQQLIQIVQDTTDLIGIRILVLSQLWEPSGPDALTAASEAPEPPAVPGGVILVGEQTHKSEGAMRTTWTFQGIKGDGKSVTFKDREHSIDYGFEPGFAQIPIQQHPKFQELLDTYGGYPDNDGARVIWPTEKPGTATGKSGFNGNGKQKSETNPMFGVQDYFRLEGTYRFRYAAMQLPAGFYDRSGTIVSTGALPGKAPPASGGRNWLFVPPPFRRRGVILDITEMYWLSGPGGWPRPVYGGAIGGSGSDNLLTDGPLTLSAGGITDSPLSTGSLGAGLPGGFIPGVTPL
jgi:hypothetical protein